MSAHKPNCPDCGSHHVFVSDSLMEAGIFDGKVEWLCWDCEHRFLGDYQLTRSTDEAES